MEWHAVGSATGVYVLEYQAAGYARANCTAIQMGDGFVILSPASNISESHIQFIEKMGPILALLSPHSGHTLGINGWLKLRPYLKVFAAPKATDRISKVCKVDVRPIEELNIKDPNVKITLAPGMGDTTLFIEITRGDRPVVYVDELLEDLDRYPGPAFIRPLMHLMGKKPGFQVNRGFIRFYVKNVQALAAEVLRLVNTGAHVIFAHGPVRSSPEDIAQAKALLESI
ncbi:hypothetical protein [Pseudobdellovibrio sp. HCB154]|uniref:hypothetical protein n=1 Tax=Pseudobdellovibrio sp. HCB154 TaxID=3386277 RepID=UPI0039172AC7